MNSLPINEQEMVVLRIYSTDLWSNDDYKIFMHDHLVMWTLKFCHLFLSLESWAHCQAPLKRLIMLSLCLYFDNPNWPHSFEFVIISLRRMGVQAPNKLSLLFWSLIGQGKFYFGQCHGITRFFFIEGFPNWYAIFSVKCLTTPLINKSRK